MSAFERVPGKCGGVPVVKGTRLPAWVLLPLLCEPNAWIRDVYPDATDEALNELRANHDADWENP